jgi:3-hydroxybutyryl-CoA dehydrogenase
MQELGVVGAGLMGAGIAQVAAQAGLQVRLCDLSETILENAVARIRRGLERLKERDALAEEVEAILGRIILTVDLQTYSQSDFVIEAIDEDAEKKDLLFSQLDTICAPEVILASNTSSISITRLAAVTRRPDKVLGMHFFNPVPAMALVEIIRGLATHEATLSAATELGERLGKTPVQVSDTPGFLVNRIFIPFLVEAIYVYQEGLASKEDIDQAVLLGLRHPMGPLALADFIGLDTLLAICGVYYREFGDPKYRPPILLRRYVSAGWLGRKSGKGFYDYTAP